MKINAEIFSRWQQIRQPGDVAEIAKRCGCSRQNIYIAWKSGKCSAKLFDVMTAFYNERADKVNEILDKTENIAE